MSEAQYGDLHIGFKNGTDEWFRRILSSDAVIKMQAFWDDKGVFPDKQPSFTEMNINRVMLVDMNEVSYMDWHPYK